MKIVWLDINSSYAHSSLALPSLHAQLPDYLDKQINWKIVSGVVSSANSSRIIQEIIEFKPDIILSTLWLFNHESVIRILKKASKLIDSTIIIGGPEFLGDNYEFLNNNRYINAVFRGDGEEQFCTIINCLIEGFPIDEIEGVCTISGERVIDNGKAVTKRFSDLIPPENSRFFCWDKPFIQLETSRGCFNKCAFCVSGIDNGVQYLQPEIIEKRINDAVIKGVKEIRILDRTFNANIVHACSLIEIFKKFEGIVRFHIEFHPAFIGERLKAILIDLNPKLLHIETGVQSLNDETTKLCRRAGSNTDVIEGIDFLANICNFDVHADIIYGLPKYSYKNTLSDIVSLIELGVAEVQIESLKLLPGTKFRLEYDIYGIIYSSEPPYEILKSDSAEFNELIKLSGVSIAVDLWYNSNSKWRVVFKKLIQSYREELLDEISEYILFKNNNIQSLNKESRATLFCNFIRSRYGNEASTLPLYWVADGLSLKKGEGKYLKRWKRDNPSLSNPFYREDKRSLEYYYLDLGERTYWVVYDRVYSGEYPIHIESIK